MHRSDEQDPLWDPKLPANAELHRLQVLLAPYAASRRPALRSLPVRPGRLRWWLWPMRGLAVAAALMLTLWSLHAYRVYWPEGEAWPLLSAHAQHSLAPGERLQTGSGETAQVQVARIGQMHIAANSVVRLIQSRSGQHRVELESGRVHARVWAPPGHFGISSGALRVVDLGCEFTLERGADGSGSLAVQSGWVQQYLGGQKQLVPAGHALKFTADSVDAPLRFDATPAMRSAVSELNQALRTSGDADLHERLASAVAVAARDEDQYTLMNLLLRAPALAGGALYPRLAQALKVPDDDTEHRAAWQRADAAAIEIWWKRLPSQPKRWWTHWRDAF